MILGVGNTICYYTALGLKHLWRWKSTFQISSVEISWNWAQFIALCWKAGTGIVRCSVVKAYLWLIYQIMFSRTTSLWALWFLSSNWACWPTKCRSKTKSAFHTRFLPGSGKRVGQAADLKTQNIKHNILSLRSYNAGKMEGFRYQRKRIILNLPLPASAIKILCNLVQSPFPDRCSSIPFLVSKLPLTGTTCLSVSHKSCISHLHFWTPGYHFFSGMLFHSSSPHFQILSLVQFNFYFICHFLREAFLSGRSINSTSDSFLIWKQVIFPV